MDVELSMGWATQWHDLWAPVMNAHRIPLFHWAATNSVLQNTHPTVHYMTKVYAGSLPFPTQKFLQYREQVKTGLIAFQFVLSRNSCLLYHQVHQSMKRGCVGKSGESQRVEAMVVILLHASDGCHVLWVRKVTAWGPEALQLLQFLECCMKTV